MSMPGFIEIKGENQGNIEGSSEKSGFESLIEIVTFKHCVDIPRNKDTSLYSGIRVHGPIRINKEIDKSTPKLYQALCSGEQLSEVGFVWCRFVKAGNPEKFFEIKLTNANIIGIQPVIRDRLEANKNQLPHLEKVSFIYEKIRWIWLPDGSEFEDTWLAP